MKTVARHVLSSHAHAQCDDLRVCSKSLKHKRQANQVEELQTGVELALAVLSQSSVFLQPSKTALDDPAFWHDFEGVLLAAFDYLHRQILTQNVPHSLCEGFARVVEVTW